METNKKTQRIFLVDDEDQNIDVLRLILARHSNYEVLSTTDALAAVGMILESRPDLVLLDVVMPKKSGLDILREVRAAEGRVSRVPVLVVTGMRENSLKIQALEDGANDFLEKPFQTAELLARIRNGLRIKEYEDHLEDENVYLEERVRARTSELNQSRIELMRRLGLAAEYRDDETGNHVQRVGAFCAILGHALNLPVDTVALLYHTSPMHDVGKIGIPDSILLKPGRLTAAEYHVIQRHPVYGAEIFRPISWTNLNLTRGEFQAIPCEAAEDPILRMAREIALTHHEWWNGAGYPNRLAGVDIPIEGRITAVADVFDALTSERPYKPAYAIDRALEIMREAAGVHLDPQIVEALMANLERINAARAEFPDDQPSSYTRYEIGIVPPPENSPEI